MVADGGDEKSSFRWLAVARFAAASVVTVLILLVIAKAIKVVQRPDSLSLSVAGGCIFTERTTNRPEYAGKILFDFGFRVGNPRSRGQMYYVNITAYLFDKTKPAWSADPAGDSFVFFDMWDTAVRQKVGMESLFQIRVIGGREMTPAIFDMLYNKTDVPLLTDVTMRLEGTLIIGLASGTNMTHRLTTYYCWPLVVGLDPDNVKGFLDLNLKDVFCREVHGTHFI
ncbi:hypothetical protein ACP70R_041957 [Stipagrostis hirtigluma subsp. patula]